MNTPPARNLVVFHPDTHVMDVDFSKLTFDVSGTVHSVYDEVEQRLAETGKKWFFLVNYHQCKVMTEASISFADRGKKVNLAYSLGSARYSVDDEMSKEVQERSVQEQFDPNLFKTRESALEFLAGLRKDWNNDDFEKALEPTLPKQTRSLADRVAFHEDLQIMEVDFSHHAFATSKDVNAMYDEITRQVSATDQKWYFMVNYADMQILPEAWYSWSMRGGDLNKAYSLGTVRFDPREGTKEEIQRRARADEFNPNIVATRDEALDRIARIKSET